MKRLLEVVIPIVGRRGVLEYFFLGVLSGLTGFLFINAVTKTVDVLIAGDYNTVSKEYLLLFLAVILLTIWFRRLLSLFSIKLSQRITWHLRLRILRLALNANYQQLSERKAKIHSAILNDVGALTNASMAVIDFFIAVIMSVSCLAYLASISFILFLVTLGVAILGIAVYVLSTNVNVQRMEKARKLENHFQEDIQSILHGYKEIFMEPRKGRFIYERKIEPLAKDSYHLSTKAMIGFTDSSIIGQVLFNILITFIVLVFSVSLGISPGDTVTYIFTLIFTLGSIEKVMALYPALIHAAISANHLLDLKADLEGFRSGNQIPAKYTFQSTFTGLQIEAIEFQYSEEASSFRIGPINFYLQKGEIVFIYGGNGSGKTTFIHTLLGMCLPCSGTISVGEQMVKEENYADYRGLYAVVFSDFYLFNEFLWEEEIEAGKWDRYLELFELEGKVSLENNVLSTVDLSAGQRKRLALMMALLEEKPILVLDEWAADQDPYFRKKFYSRILPLLRDEGFTVIAITHDDKYYHYADRLYKMDEGKLYPDNSFSLEEPNASRDSSPIQKDAISAPD